MSSIIKKATQFKPRFKSKPIRRKQGSATPTPLTPPATQVNKEQTPQEQDEVEVENVQDKEELQSQIPDEPAKSSQPFEDPILTAESTVVIPNIQVEDTSKQQPKPSFSFTIKPKEKSSSSSEVNNKATEDDEEIIDPKDSSRMLEVDSTEKITDEDKEKEDDEVFKLPTYERERQHSVVPQRRLSGITPTAIRSRSGSISIRTSVAESEGGASAAQLPAKIGIPIVKPVKRRRSSVVNRGSATLKKPSLSLASATTITIPREAKSLSIVVPGATESTNREAITASKIEEVAEPMSKEPSVVADKKDIESKYIVGVDPTTKRLRKFLRPGVKLSPEEISEILPEAESLTTAPEDLITSINSVKQLPLTKVKNSDAELFAAIDFDVSEMTMADLCKPFLPIGKTSSNFELVNQAEEKIRQRKEDRRRAREVARNNRISIEQASGETEEGANDRENRKNSNLLDLDDETGGSGATQSLMLKMQGDQITFDQNSTLIDRHLQTSHSNLIREESNPFENPITSSTYSKRRHTDKWTGYEVQQFYEALSTFGTDFSLISQLFPHRSRKQIKSKFNLEEKKYPEIIEMALRRKLPGDFDTYCMNINKEIKTLEQYNDELKQVRLQHEQDLATISEERERAMQEDAEASRRREIEIRTGAKTMTRAEKLKELRKNEMIVGSIDDVKKQREDIEL
ncbi:hypothetical protein DFJ63DRAFT_334682 [Scheffersomyces coipomensis]|uniref:uncharacterized protein n=1 Tax=Scheffersomyces coipomensis TaxID=1788519 RepID=UPI00315C899C